MAYIARSSSQYRSLRLPAIPPQKTRQSNPPPSFAYIIIVCALIVIGLVILLINIATFPFSPSSAITQMVATNENCPAPCLLGIQLDMDWDDAVGILQGNEWVESISVSSSGSTATINWKAEYTTPFDSPGILEISSGRIQQFKINPAGRYGDIIATLGEPDWGAITPIWMSSAIDPLRHEAAYMYNDRYMFIRTIAQCPLSPTAFWNAPIEEVRLSHNRQWDVPDYDLAQWYDDYNNCE